MEILKQKQETRAGRKRPWGAVVISFLIPRARRLPLAAPLRRPPQLVALDGARAYLALSVDAFNKLEKMRKRPKTCLQLIRKTSEGERDKALPLATNSRQRSDWLAPHGTKESDLSAMDSFG